MASWSVTRPRVHPFGKLCLKCPHCTRALLTTARPWQKRDITSWHVNCFCCCAEHCPNAGAGHTHPTQCDPKPRPHPIPDRGVHGPDLVRASGNISHRVWRGQAGGWTRVWRRPAEAWTHVRRRAADVWKPVPYPPCAFFCTAPPCSAPLRCARAPWLRDRVPSQAAMAVVMADNCHGILAWFASGRVWWRLGSRPAGSGKMEGSRLAACGLPHAGTKSGTGSCFDRSVF